MKKYKTKQEKFWSGNFGNKYLQRNKRKYLLKNKNHLFKTSLKKADNIKSCIELGAGSGFNLICLKKKYPKAKFFGLEINSLAAKELEKVIIKKNIINESALKWKFNSMHDLVLTCGFLIHIAPNKLNRIYKLIYKLSKKYILICEYYNPQPVKVKYRKHKDKLYKRDFAGEILKKFKGLKLIDYGFVYKSDPCYPLDDINWFLIKKVKK